MKNFLRIIIVYSVLNVCLALFNYFPSAERPYCNETEGVGELINGVNNIGDTFILNMKYIDIPRLCFNATNEVLKNYTNSLEMFSIEKSNISYIERPFNNFKNLKIVVLTNGSIASVKEDDFRNVRKLTHLNLMSNKINFIESRAFAENKNLKVLDLDSNDLTYIRRGWLNQTSIRRLNLQKNGIKLIDSNTFNGMSKLEILMLGYNSLTMLNKKWFKNLPEFRCMFLNNNLISEIRATDLHEFNNRLSRIKINFSHNRIRFFSKEALPVRYLNISLLDLSHNLIETLDVGTFRIAVIDELHLNNNKIRKLEPNTFRGSYINYINLNNNELETIEENIFNEDVYRIFLRKNKIFFVHQDAFKGLDKLDLLDLGDNQLRIIEPSWSRQARSLSVLYFDKNLIRTLLPYQFDSGNHTYRAKYYLYDMSLSNIQEKAFDGGNHSIIETLALDYNALEIIDVDIFKYRRVKKIFAYANPLLRDSIRTFILAASQRVYIEEGALDFEDMYYLKRYFSTKLELQITSEDHTKELNVKMMSNVDFD